MDNGDKTLEQLIQLPTHVQWWSNLWSNNKRKDDANFQAAREEQIWYSKLFVQSNHDSNFCVNTLTNILQYKFLLEQLIIGYTFICKTYFFAKF